MKLLIIVIALTSVFYQACSKSCVGGGGRSHWGRRYYRYGQPYERMRPQPPIQPSTPTAVITAAPLIPPPLPIPPPPPPPSQTDPQILSLLSNILALLQNQRNQQPPSSPPAPPVPPAPPAPPAPPDQPFVFV